MSCIPCGVNPLECAIVSGQVFNNVSVGALYGNSEPGTSCVDACVAAFLAMIPDTVARIHRR